VKIDILSLFPDYFLSPLQCSILRRAIEKGAVEVRRVDIRDFAEGRHAKVDDRPYGGGPGMVLMPGPVCRAIRSCRQEGSHVVFLSPQGKPLTAKRCAELATKEHLVLLCGHYEGIDERVMKEIDEEISIGDYVVTSGCPAALVLLDATVRFLPGVLGDEESALHDSFEEAQRGGFDAPHYTRPEEFEGDKVPEVLLSGHHAQIAAWRKDRAEVKTAAIRPEL
jgi:tRNA (guanine37-N1)-methyltransferase